MTPAERTALLAVAAHVLDRIAAAGLETDDRPRHWIADIQRGTSPWRVARDARESGEASNTVAPIGALSQMVRSLAQQWIKHPKRHAATALWRLHGPPLAAARAQIDLLYARELERAQRTLNEVSHA